MATVNGKTSARQVGILQSVWVLGNADQGTSDQLSRYPQHSVQIGTTGENFGGATVVVEGSDDGIAFFTLKDVAANNVSATAVALFDVESVPLHIRPRSSGGTGTSVTVTITSRFDH